MEDKQHSLNALIEDSIKKNWDSMALSDMGGINYQYKDVAETVAKLHIMFRAAGLKEGDRVAICGKNSSNWVVVLIACCLLYTSPSPRDAHESRMPSSA